MIRLPPTADGRPVLATLSDFGAPVLAQLSPLIQGANDEMMQTRTLEVDGETWYVTVSPLKLEAVSYTHLIIFFSHLSKLSQLSSNFFYFINSLIQYFINLIRCPCSIPYNRKSQSNRFFTFWKMFSLIQIKNLNMSYIIE